MKTIKGLLLGAAAVLSMGSVASAADLPAAEPVEYVRICDAFGAGYFFIPGTDTCLRISGFVRFQVHVHSTVGTVSNWDGDLSNVIAPTRANIVNRTALNYNNVDTYDHWARALLRFDARSRTEWGILRSFIEIAASGDNGANDVVRYAFVQFGLGGGTVTAGIADSFFAFEGPASLGTPVAAPDGVYYRRNVLAYTASFGSGISATISLEDSTTPGLGGGGATALTLSQAGTDFVRNRVQMPDLVGNVRVAQAWGTAQLSAAVGQYRFRDTSGFNGLVTTYNDTAWAIQGGLRLNLDMLSRGSNFTVSAAYADGALFYLGSGMNGGSRGLQAAWSQNFAQNAIESSKGFSISAGFQYFFTPAVRAAIFGGYVDLDHPVGTITSGELVLLDRAWSVGANVIWSPVRNLDLGLEVFYTNNRYQALNGATATTAGTVAGTREVDGWGTIFRIQRSF